MKTVLITGGSRGIGRAMVELFSKNGYSVAFTYKASSKLAEELSFKTGALSIQADSAKQEDVERAVSAAREHFGSIDCLINNAGISGFSMFSDITLSDWNEMLSVNLTGAFLYTRAVVGDMINKKCGRIINISSMWGVVGSSCEVHYSTAKAGLIGMTKALAKELGPSGITVNAIAPGLIDTDMNSSLSSDDILTVTEDTPLMRVGTADEVANAALYLASDEASFITAQVLNVSGGYIV